MLNKIIEFSVRNKLIIVLFTLGLIVYGVYETTRLPIDAQPDITNNQVQILTVAPSYGAADIERLVTFPIEQSTSNIAGLTEIRSFSRFGLSLVTVVFNDATDVYWARQQVAERLQLIKDQIPSDIGAPELGPISTGLGEIFQYVVRAKEGYQDRYDETELRTIQDWIIRRQLLGTSGVAEVSSFGGKLKQYEIAINPSRLQALQLNIHAVFKALEENNQNTGGAYIEKNESVLFIRSEGLIKNKEDIDAIPVATTTDGQPVLMRDVADVRVGHATRYGAMTYNNEGEVSGAIVMMLKGENANKVIHNIKERLEAIQKTLPEGVIIEPFLDRAKMVNNTIGTVKTNLMEGALIVVFILVLFLGNLRAGLIVASVIPLSMLFAVICMNFFGVGGNLMSLGALDFGLVVDGAVIIVEAVLHQLAHRKNFGTGFQLSRHQMNVQVTGAASKMVNSAVFGQIIILIVYLPILTLQGIEGKMFKPMAQTVVFALIGAFVLSLTYIPMMSALFLSRRKRQKVNVSDRVMNRLEKGHQRFLILALKFRKTVLTGVILLFAGALVLLSRMGGEFIPSLEEGDFAVEMRILPGSNIPKTIEVTNKAANILRSQFPEVEKVVTKIGSAEIPTEPMPMDAGDMIVVLKPKKEWTSAKTFPELSEKMSKALEVIPGLTTGFQFPVQMRFNELMTGARQDVVVKIFGEDLDSLAIFAQRLGSIVHSVAGAEDLYIEPLIGAPQVIIDYDRSALARHRISIAAANKVVNAAFAGQQAGMVYEGEKRFGLVVRLANENRQHVEDIRNLLLPGPSGRQIPLHQVAKIELGSSPNQIQREDTKRRIVVGFNVRGRDVQGIVQELQKKVDSGIHLPTGYGITYGGAFENLNEAKARLGVAVPVSLALIFLLLFFAFGSVKHSLLIYTAIPLSAIGGIYFLSLRDMPFSISAGVGFIALFGVAVLNGIVLISEFNRLRKQGMTNTTRIVLTGTRVRLRPVLMTAFVASLGFLPMAISQGSGAEVQRPLATVVIGGLLLATLLTLFVLPLLYVLFENFKQPKLKWISKKTLLLLLAGSAGFLDVRAQQTLSLPEALAAASKHNPQVIASQLTTHYKEKLIGTYFDVPQTEITAEMGKINSIEIDQKLGVSQRMNFPSVYAKRKQLLREEWQVAIFNQELTLLQIQRLVSEVFYRILVLQEKQKILLRTDSLYTLFATKVALKVKTGESPLMESASADLQQQQIAVQLKALKTELKGLQMHLALLIHREGDFVLVAPSVKVTIERNSPLTDMNLHPEMRRWQQELKISEAETKVARSKLLPDVSFSYFNQSMKDIHSGRFSSVQLGVGIPLFTRSQRANIQASKEREQLVRQDIEWKKNQWETHYQQTTLQVENHQEIIENYEKWQLPRANSFLQTAKKQYEEGEIDYLEWIILSNQAISIQSSYLDALQLFNESALQLNYLQSKKP